MPDRYLTALPRGSRTVSLSWRLLASDRADVGFNVHRRLPGAAWDVVSPAPVTDTTCFIDTAPDAKPYEYRVTSIAAPDDPSESVRVDSGADASIAILDVPLISPAQSTHELAPGDLLNNGRTGYIATVREDGQQFLDAYGGYGAADGRHLWRVPLGFPNNIYIDHTCGPYLVWDINHDGRSEVVCRLSRGNVWKNEIEQSKTACPDSYPWEKDVRMDPRPGDMLVALDGETGDLVWEVPWPGPTFSAHMTLGYLNGRENPPALVIRDTQPYGPCNLYAMSGIDGHQLWHVHQQRPSGHNLDVADLDRDGVQEVICGGACYNGDGSVNWEAEPFGHTDISKPAHILPGRDDMQVWFAVEGENQGVYLVDKDGKTVWKETYRHAHYGWLARHIPGVPGLHPHTSEDARYEFGAAETRQGNHFPIFHPDGSTWLNLTDWQRKNFVPVHWDGGPEVTFAIRIENKRIVRLLASGEIEDVPGSKLPEGGKYGRNLCTLDIAGDYRENITTTDLDTDRLIILANPNPASTRGTSPCDDWEYLHDCSQLGSGYYIYLSPPVTTTSG